MSSTLAAYGIDKLSRDERISLVQDIWDSLADDDDAPELSEAQKCELERRVAELDANPTNVLTWEEIKAQVKDNQGILEGSKKRQPPEGSAMRTIILASLALLTWLPIASVSGAEPKPLTPAEEYQALVAAQKQADDDFQKAYRAAKTDEERQKASKEFGRKAGPDYHAGRFLELMRKYPDDSTTLTAAGWLLSRTSGSTPEATEAVKILIRDWIHDERIVGLCKSQVHYASDQGSELLRAAIEKSPHRRVQGYARYSLALNKRKEADAHAEHSADVRAKFEQEAEKLFQQVIDKYADLDDSQRRDTPLGKSAKAHLFVLKHLSIGKVAPNIEGVDIHGNPLKLSEYRGKVVLIDFWGTWCGPCVGGILDQRTLALRLKDKPFATVGVNNDKERKAPVDFWTKENIPWRCFWDGDKGPICEKWHIDSWPTLYLLDAKGVIRYKGQRLTSHSARRDKDGKVVQFSYLDDAVDGLLQEMADAKKP